MDNLQSQLNTKLKCIRHQTGCMQFNMQKSIVFLFFIKMEMYMLVLLCDKTHKTLSKQMQYTSHGLRIFYLMIISGSKSSGFHIHQISCSFTKLLRAYRTYSNAKCHPSREGRAYRRRLTSKRGKREKPRYNQDSRR